MQFPDVRYVAITSDEHYQPSMTCGPWSRYPLIRGDAERSAAVVNQWCADHYSEGIVRISCADTLDTPEPQPDRLLWLKKYFEEHLAYCKGYLYIQGQHERVIKCPNSTWMDVITNSNKVHHINKKRFSIGDQLFAGIDNTNPVDLFSFVEDLDEQSRYNLITHQLWYPWLPASKVYPSLKQLPPQIRRVFSGDYHVVKNDILLTDHGQQLEAYSVGPFCMQSWGEEPVNRFLVLDLKLDQVLNVPLPSRQVFRGTVNTEEDLEVVLTNLSKLPKYTDPTSVDMALVKISYNSKVPYVQKRLEEVAEGKFHFFIEPFVQDEQLIDMRKIYGRASATESVKTYLDSHSITAAGTLIRHIIDATMEANNPKELEMKLEELKTQYAGSIKP